MACQLRALPAPFSVLKAARPKPTRKKTNRTEQLSEAFWQITPRSHKETPQTIIYYLGCLTRASPQPSPPLPRLTARLGKAAPPHTPHTPPDHRSPCGPGDRDSPLRPRRPPPRRLASPHRSPPSAAAPCPRPLPGSTGSPRPPGRARRRGRARRAEPSRAASRVRRPWRHRAALRGCNSLITSVQLTKGVSSTLGRDPRLSPAWFPVRTRSLCRSCGPGPRRSVSRRGGAGGVRHRRAAFVAGTGENGRVSCCNWGF